MSSGRPSFQMAKRFGYDTRTVDQAVDWAMTHLRQGTPVSKPAVDALRFELVRRGGYVANEVDEWFDSLPSEGSPDGIGPESSPATSTLPRDLRVGGIDSPTRRGRRLRTQVVLVLLVVTLLVALIVYFV